MIIILNNEKEITEMNRFFGMMPSSEIEKEKYYKDEDGFKVNIQAGTHGWSIIWADSSSCYKDVDATTEENFKTAYDFAVSKVGSLKEIL